MPSPKNSSPKTIAQQRERVGRTERGEAATPPTHDRTVGLTIDNLRMAARLAREHHVPHATITQVVNQEMRGFGG